MAESEERKESADQAEPAETRSAFEKASELERIGIVTEFWYFLKDNKKWWLTPIILVLAMVGVLIALSSTAAAPFIYTLF